jgi:hypothetical protein
MFTQYFNILNDIEFDYIVNTIKKSKWMYGRKSNESDVMKFWEMDLNNNDFLKNVFLPKIETLTNTKFSVIQIVANGQTFGQEGSWHSDSSALDDYTFVFYTNVCDDISLVGETYFKDNQNNISIVTPTPNSGIYFSSSTIHKGCAPKMEFNDIRTTIAFKLTAMGELKNTKTLL